MAKDFIKEIEDQFTANEKVETNTTINKIVSMRYKGKGNVREYIIEMSNLMTKLRAFKLELSDDILVQLVLISFPSQFSQYKVSYDTQKEKWTSNKPIAQYVEEEDRLKQETIESAHLTSTFGTKVVSHKWKRSKNKETSYKGTLEFKDQKPCFFYKKLGHMKKKCSKYVVWRSKKGVTS
ncbi:hypothetical protein KY285_024046 [Solanum tuberosum]|nr:hypothetical protein KY285_024046 [Solanum tuberosum]